jgi:hypothetical protein
MSASLLMSSILNGIRKSPLLMSTSSSISSSTGGGGGGVSAVAAILGISAASSYHMIYYNDYNDESTSTTSTNSTNSTNRTNNNSITYCDTSKSTHSRSKEIFQEQQKLKANLKKRMTAIGKFSLKSQTENNPSQPTFFLALSNAVVDSGDNVHNNGNKQSYMTANAFKKIWFDNEMHIKHPRFHSKVTSCGEFFEPTNRNGNTNYTTTGTKTGTTTGTHANADFEMHASETLHMNVYRQDLKMRIEQLLTQVMDVKEKLWEVQLSSGQLGSSGAISSLRSNLIVEQQQEKEQQQYDDKSGKGTKPQPQPKPPKLMETVMLFRCHHSLGDAVSIVSALGDLLDEAQEIQEKIKAHIRSRKLKHKSLTLLQRILKQLKTMIWFFFGSIQAIMRQGYLVYSTPKNPFLQVLGLSREQEQLLIHGNGSGTGNSIGSRSISWCDVAVVDEVKYVAKVLGGPRTTLNDIFVSCVTAAVAKQLAYNREQANRAGDGGTGTGTGSKGKDSAQIHHQINVVIPAHLAGGILPPGRGIGNLIGAFVARVPGEMQMQSDGSHNSPSQRLEQVHTSLDTSKRSPAPIIGYLMAKFSSNYLPESLATALFHRSSANAAVAISNSRGYEQKVHINGRAVESMAGFYPLPPGLPVGVLVQSYGNVVSLSVTAEKWAVPDADQFLKWVVEEYQLLCKEAALKQEQGLRLGVNRNL